MKMNQEIMMKIMQHILRGQKQPNYGPLLPEGVKFPIPNISSFDALEKQLEDVTFFNALM